MKILKISEQHCSCNCYCLVNEKKEAIIIDPGSNEPHITSILTKENLVPKYILLTHGHADHIGAVPDLVAKFDVQIVASLQEKEVLENKSKNLSYLFSGNTIEFSADIYFDAAAEDSLHLLDNSIEILFTPGHTAGSCCYILNDFLLSGDTLFNDSIGRTDLPGGSSREMRRSLDKIKALEKDYAILPGHGPNSNLNREKDRNPFLNGYF